MKKQCGIIGHANGVWVRTREIGRADDGQTLLSTTRPDREASCNKNDSNERKEEEKVEPRQEYGIGLFLVKPSDPLLFSLHFDYNDTEKRALDVFFFSFHFVVNPQHKPTLFFQSFDFLCSHMDLFFDNNKPDL